MTYRFRISSGTLASRPSARLVSLAAACALALAVAPTSATAGLGLPGTSVNTYASVWYSQQSPDSPAQDSDSAEGAWVSSWTTAQYGRQGNGPKTSFFGEASAAAAVGSLSAYAHIDLWQSEVWSTHHLAISTASFSDLLSISAASSGTAGYLQYVMKLDGGVVGASPNAQATAQLSLAQDGLCQSLYLSGSGPITSDYFPIVFGEPFYFTATLEAWVAMVSDRPGFSGDVTVDYNRSARLTGINVFDADHNQISTFGLTSDSGWTYGAPLPSGAPVPEPGSLLALGVGFTGFVGAFLRKPRTRIR